MDSSSIGSRVTSTQSCSVVFLKCLPAMTLKLSRVISLVASSRFTHKRSIARSVALSVSTTLLYLWLKWYGIWRLNLFEHEVLKQRFVFLTRVWDRALSWQRGHGCWLKNACPISGKD